ncbi:hypothetical protein [Acetobacter nitrogenifigens]|uniref:hypothetical protein n=1 Tax=Acetobacter nitrogenifigens TaxID=285268 RepID=UPI000412995A|nr:hypothetical protein [Acetobacter nitrogenifigens]
MTRRTSSLNLRPDRTSSSGAVSVVGSCRSGNATAADDARTAEVNLWSIFAVAGGVLALAIALGLHTPPTLQDLGDATASFFTL